MKIVNVIVAREGYKNIENLNKCVEFYRYQKVVNRSLCDVVSHTRIEEYVKWKNYRYQEEPQPIKNLIIEDVIILI